MKTALIVFASSTGSSRLKNLAAREHIRNVKITQTPKRIKTEGCSYSLRVDIDDLTRILDTARRYRVNYLAVYGEEKDLSGTVMYRRL